MAGPTLHLAQKQDLALTADLREAIELLTLSSLDVQQLINQELADNPCLDMAQGEEYDSSTASESEGDWDDTLNAVADAGLDGPIGLTAGGMADADAPPAWDAAAPRAPSLEEHLVQQLHCATTNATLRRVGHFIIQNLDDIGYWRGNIPETAAHLGVPDDMVDDARALIQTFDPVGIGAVDLADCLRLQLHATDNLTPVAEVCLQHLDKLATRDLAGLAKLAHTSMAEIAATIGDIQQCNPRPAGDFATARIDAVVPDVIVTRTADGTWHADLNGRAFPSLLANPPPKLEGALAKSPRAQQAKHYMSERFGRAKWLIGALEQRAQNILKIARAVVVAQTQFLEAGAEFMVPLTLRDIAAIVGVHESTVSRVTTGKYMQTPRGVFEFKHFFASGVGSTGGNVDIASRSVQAMISRFVKAEDPKKPLSDQALVAMLQGEGVTVARRTIAKYRGILHIPGTAERRVR